MLKNRFVGLPMIAATLAFGSATFAQAEAEMFSDSGIDGPPYQQIFQQMADQAASSQGWATTHDYGQTHRGKTLRLIKIQDPTFVARDGTYRAAVLISGSTHGNEYLNIEDRLAEWFLANRSTSPGVQRYLANGGIIYVIPILNPDGYDDDERGNSRGVDLNRDFDLPPTGDRFFREPETRLLTQWLDQELIASGARLKVTLDYHCCVGALVLPWAYSDDPLPTEANQRHVEVALAMQQILGREYAYGNSSQIVGYNSKGTSKDYYYAKYDAVAFTFEGAYRDEAAKFPQHTRWWDGILGRLSGTEAR